MRVRPEVVAASVVALMCALMVTAIGLLMASEIGRAVRDSHERAAIRAVIRGDCRAALAESDRAGSLPYEVKRLCLGEPS